MFVVWVLEKMEMVFVNIPPTPRPCFLSTSDSCHSLVHGSCIYYTKELIFWSSNEMLSVNVNTTQHTHCVSHEETGRLSELWLSDGSWMHEEFPPRSLLKVAQGPSATVARSVELWFRETFASEAPVRGTAVKAWVPQLTERVTDRVQKRGQKGERKRMSVAVVPLHCS